MQKLYMCLFISIFFISACKPTKIKKAPEKKTSKITVGIQKIQYKKWVETFKSFGVIEAADTIHISTDFSALVKKVHVNEGMQIKQGDLLITFDDTKKKLELVQAKMFTKTANASVSNMKIQLQRKQTLYNKGMISRETLDDTITAYEQAISRAKEALAGELLIEQKLQDMILYSPVSGRLEKPKIKTGETVLPGSKLFTIQTLNTIRVITYVNEKRINRIRLGNKAEVYIPGAKGKKFIGHIETIGIEADPKTGNFPVKIALSNENGLLRPGMMAKATLFGLFWDKAIIIPEKSIQDRNLKRVVYLFVNGKAKETEVEFGMPLKDQVPVLSGLHIGDLLIVEGAHLLNDQSPVMQKNVSKEVNDEKNN